MPHRDTQFVTPAVGPAVAGPYSKAAIVAGFAFIAGQAGRDPATGLVPTSFEQEVEQTLRNVEEVLRSLGADLTSVVRSGVYLTDIRLYAPMNAVYARVFGNHRPARTTVGVAALPAPEYRIEIDVVAYVGEAVGHG